MSGIKNSNACSLRFRIISLSLTVGLIIFAFVHSMMPADVSGKESGTFLLMLQNLLHSMNINFEISELFIRKAAHFTEYTAIGALLMTSAYSFDKQKPLKYYSQMLFVGLASAVIDETIQLGVEGRSGQVSDVLLDFSGVLTGILIMAFAFSIYKRIRNRG